MFWLECFHCEAVSQEAEYHIWKEKRICTARSVFLSPYKLVSSIN